MSHQHQKPGKSTGKPTLTTTSSIEGLPLDGTGRPPNLLGDGKSTVNHPGGIDPKILAAVTQMESLLKGFSYKEAKQALQMVGVLHNLKVQSINGPTLAPIGAQPRSKIPTAKGKGKGQTPKAAWRNDPRMVDLQKEREEAIATLKSFKGSEEDKATIVANVHSLEGQMKALKKELSGTK